MRALRLITGIAVTVLLAGSSSTTLASLSVAYQIHEIPDDPNSPVAFVVTLTVDEADREGNSIGWEIVEARFEGPGNPTTAWIENDPLVNTSDGLWWIEHADPNNPAIEEFVEPPELSGTATAPMSAGDDLIYTFNGVSYNAQLRGLPYAVTGAVNYSFQLVNATEPLLEGEDGPVEVGSDNQT